MATAMRLFLGLFPPPEVRARLGALAEAAQAHCGGRRMPDDSLHLTLAFLGDQPAERTEALGDWLRHQAIPPGHWRLDRWGHFRRPGIVWIGSARPTPALEALQGELWAGLEALGIGGRPERFVPHITLLRKAARPPGPDLPRIAISWVYTRVELIQSVITQQGSHYRTLARTVLPEEMP